MPYISIESGNLTAEQKKQLIERLTATASEITESLMYRFRISKGVTYVVCGGKKFCIWSGLL